MNNVKEIWKPIVGYEGLYEVSNLGKIKTLNLRSHNGVIGFMSGTITTKGYRRVLLTKNGIKKGLFVHRLVAIAFIKNPLNKPEVNHKDGDKLNNNIDNLEWSTTKENVEHAININLRPRYVGLGELSSQAKLTSNQVIEIFKSKDTCVSLGLKYGVHPTTIHLIKKGHNWGHITSHL